MVTVVVRRAEGGKGVALGEFYPSDLPELVSLAKKFQTHIDEVDCVFEDAQFVADESGVVFEIIVDEVDCLFVGSGDEN